MSDKKEIRVIEDKHLLSDTWETLGQYHLRVQCYKEMWERSWQSYLRSLQPNEPPKVTESYRSDHNKKNNQ